MTVETVKGSVRGGALRKADRLSFSEKIIQTVSSTDGSGRSRENRREPSRRRPGHGGINEKAEGKSSG